MNEDRRFGEARFWILDGGGGIPATAIYRVWGATFDIFDGTGADFRPATPAEREESQAFFQARRLREVPEMMASMEMFLLWGSRHQELFKGSPSD